MSCELPVYKFSLSDYGSQSVNGDLRRARERLSYDEHSKTPENTNNVSVKSIMFSLAASLPSTFCLANCVENQKSRSTSFSIDEIVYGKCGRISIRMRTILNFINFQCKCLTRWRHTDRDIILFAFHSYVVVLRVTPFQWVRAAGWLWLWNDRVPRCFWLQPVNWNQSTNHGTTDYIRPRWQEIREKKKRTKFSLNTINIFWLQFVSDAH